MDPVVGVKRNRETEDQGDREAKIAKFDHERCGLSDLHEELLLQILVNRPKKDTGNLCLVSKQWQQITRSRNFWKLSCQRRWPDIVASDSLDFNQKEYLMPTLVVNGKTLIDWKFYYNLRKKYGRTSKLIADFMRTIEEKSEELAALLGKSSELTLGWVTKCIEVMPILSMSTGFDPLAVPCIDLVCDVALIMYKRDDMDWFRPMIELLGHLVVHNQSKAKLFSFCKRSFELCQLVRDNSMPQILYGLLNIVTRIMILMKPFDDRCKKLFVLVTEFVIHLGTAELPRDVIAELGFQYPYPNIGIGLLSRRKLGDVVLEVANREYYTSNDWRIQASAVCVASETFLTNKEYVRRYYVLALHAAEQSNEQLSYAGIVGLHRLVMNVDGSGSLDAKEWSKLFEIFTNFIVGGKTFKANQHGKTIYRALLQLIPNIKSKLISDELLNKFVSGVLDVLKQTEVFQEAELPLVYGLWKIVKPFVHRLKNKMQEIKATLFDLVKAGKLLPERVLECYVMLGKQVKGGTFTEDFRELTKQIVDGALPFEVSTIKCCERFGDTWVTLAESESQRTQIVQTLLSAIPKEVLEFGQSSTTTEQPEAATKSAEAAEFPETFAELMKEHNKEVGPRETPVPPKFFVKKEHLKPVNPSGIIGQYDPGQELRNEIIRTHNAAVQLAMIIVNNESKYMAHAQDILHALLAMFRIGGWRTYSAISALIHAVKVEMAPADLIKYVDIILQAVIDVLEDEEDNEAALLGMSELYALCFNVMEGSPTPVKSSTIAKAINVSLMYDSSPRKLMEVGEMIHHFITSWPRNAYDGVSKSNIAVWLLKRVKDGVSLTQIAPYLCVFSNVAALYGIDYMLDVLCIDDPDEDYWESPKKYMERIVPHCKALYQAAMKDVVKISELNLSLLRNFLILHAICGVDNFLGGIGMVPKLDHYLSNGLKAVLENERAAFDTGVHEFPLVQRLDMETLCKVLLLVPEKNEDEHEDVSEEQEV
jgi:hypothetical protein